MRSQRQLKVGEELRHALAQSFQRDEFHWPEGVVPVPITVTEVQISPDLKNATAFVLPLGGADAKMIVTMLNAGSGFFRRVIARSVRLRNVPQLVFMIDTSFDYAQRIETLLHHHDGSRDERDE